MTDEGVVREGERVPLTQERPSLETPPSLSDGWTAAHPWEEGVNIPLLSPATRSRIYLQDVCTYSDLVAFFSQIPALPSDGNFDK